MKNSILPGLTSALVTGLLMLYVGCKKPDAEITPTATPPQPKAAASQLQQAFTSANAEIQSTAAAASEAIRTANYEQAIQSLQVMTARTNLTFEQGIAVYNSERALEAKLIAGMSAGDPNAKRAYELLKKSRRN